MTQPGRQSFEFDNPRKARSRKARPVPEAISAEGTDEPWLRGPGSFFCATVVSPDPQIAGSPRGKDGT
jgi:hypothetical protein